MMFLVIMSVIAVLESMMRMVFMSYKDIYVKIGN